MQVLSSSAVGFLVTEICICSDFNIDLQERERGRREREREKRERRERESFNLSLLLILTLSLPDVFKSNKLIVAIEIAHLTSYLERVLVNTTSTKNNKYLSLLLAPGHILKLYTHTHTHV